MRRILLALAVLAPLVALAADFDDADKRRTIMLAHPVADGGINTEFERRAWMLSYKPGGEAGGGGAPAGVGRHMPLLGVGG